MAIQDTQVRANAISGRRTGTVAAWVRRSVRRGYVCALSGALDRHIGDARTARLGARSGALDRRETARCARTVVLGYVMERSLR